MRAKDETDGVRSQEESLPKVRIVRVLGKPQNYAAYQIDGDVLLGYCGRDGVVVNPVGSVVRGMRTKVVETDESALVKRGLRRSVGTVQKLFARKPIDEPPDPRLKWKESGRKELGFYASSAAAGLGYFQMVYEISEHLEGDLKRVRTRVEQGPPCRLYGEAYTAFISLYKTYVNHARAHAAGEHGERESGCYLKTDGEPQAKRAIQKVPTKRKKRKA